MKKIFYLSLMAMLMVCSKSFGQTLVATLTHGETVTFYYGDSAFVFAQRAAIHGDEILLSSGSFITLGIDKAITLRGAGMEEDSLTAIAPTILRNDCWVDIANPGDNHLQVEGICFQHNFYFSYSNPIVQPQFSNCQFRSHIYMYSNYNQPANVSDAVFIHCKIAYGPCNGSSYSYNATATFINCILKGVSTNDNVFYTFRNCNIQCDARELSDATIANCIIYNVDYGGSAVGGGFPESTHLSNCVSQSEKTFANSMNTTNKVVAMKNLFEGYSGDTFYMPTFNYKLKEAAATTYLGVDGTQVGIWGGNLPFNAIPNGPRVKKLAVGNQQADGKLKVTVEVQ